MTTESATEHNLNSSDPGREILALLTKEILRRLSDEERVKAMTPAEMEMIRKLLVDNSVTLASIRRGQFGQVAQAVAEEAWPFPEGPRDPIDPLKKMEGFGRA